MHYGFITDLAFSGASVLDASTAAKGVVEIATQIEAASSTSSGGTGASLVIPASSATSTYNSATAALRAVITQNNGFLDPKFIFNGLALTFPSAHGASSTALATNGSGAMTWMKIPFNLNASSSNQVVMGTATTSLLTATVPANALGTNGRIRARIEGIVFRRNTGTNLTIAASLGGVGTSTIRLDTLSTAETHNGYLEFYVYANNSASAQRNTLIFTGATTSPPYQFGTPSQVAPVIATSTASVNTTSATTLFIVANPGD